MWALGCVIAELLIGMPLFMGCTAEDILVQLPMGPEAFDGMLSLAGREVLAGLLSYNPCERLTAADALQHRWFAEEDAAEPPAAGKAEYPGSSPLSSAAQEWSSSQWWLIHKELLVPVKFDSCSCSFILSESFHCQQAMHCTRIPWFPCNLEYFARRNSSMLPRHLQCQS
jgi:serine/threonine protein kinase